MAHTETPCVLEALHRRGRAREGPQTPCVYVKLCCGSFNLEINIETF